MKKETVIRVIGCGICGILLIGLGIYIGKINVDNMTLAKECTSLKENITQMTQSSEKLKEENTALQEQLDEVKTEYANERKDRQASEKAASVQDKAATKEENEKLAVAITRAYLQGEGYVPRYVQVDHMEKDIFVVHAYDIMYFNENGEETGCTQTVGWYDVDPSTWEIQSMF